MRLVKIPPEKVCQEVFLILAKNLDLLNTSIDQQAYRTSTSKLPLAKNLLKGCILRTPIIKEIRSFSLRLPKVSLNISDKLQAS